MMIQRIYDVAYINKGSYGRHAIVAARSKRAAKDHIRPIAITGYTKAARSPCIFRFGLRTTTLYDVKSLP